MTHQQWLKQNDKVRGGQKIVSCDQTPVHVRGFFSWDVQWELFKCPCGLEVVTVGGSVHNWNYDREPQPEGER